MRVRTGGAQSKHPKSRRVLHAEELSAEKEAHNPQGASRRGTWRGERARVRVLKRGALHERCVRSWEPFRSVYVSVPHDPQGASLNKGLPGSSAQGHASPPVVVAVRGARHGVAGPREEDAFEQDGSSKSARTDTMKWRCPSSRQDSQPHVGSLASNLNFLIRSDGASLDCECVLDQSH